jgi:hypothetical protein
VVCLPSRRRVRVAAGAVRHRERSCSLLVCLLLVANTTEAEKEMPDAVLLIGSAKKTAGAFVLAACLPVEERGSNLLLGGGTRERRTEGDGSMGGFC